MDQAGLKRLGLISSLSGCFSRAAELRTLPDAQSPAPSANLEQQELIVLIHETVGNLSETLRETLSLFYFEGYSVEDAAK